MMLTLITYNESIALRLSVMWVVILASVLLVLLADYLAAVGLMSSKRMRYSKSSSTSSKTRLPSPSEPPGRI